MQCCRSANGALVRGLWTLSRSFLDAKNFISSWENVVLSRQTDMARYQLLSLARHLAVGSRYWPMRGKPGHYLTNEHSTDRPPHSNEHQVKDLS